MNFFKNTSPFKLLIYFHAVVLVISLSFLAVHKGSPHQSREKIVVLPINGVISMNEGAMNGETVHATVKYINKMKDDKDVKALVLQINSPGGSVGAVQELYRALQQFKAEGKIIVSSFGDVSASGGYYLAALSDKIFANPGTITGSIGVIMQVPSIGKLLDKYGVGFEIIKSGDMKDSGSPFRKMTSNERNHFNTLIMDAYAQFYEAVKTGRKLEDKILKPSADGRVFTGRMAVEAKLVDELGGLTEAIEKAKELAGLKDKEPEIVYKKEKMGLERILRLMGKSPLDKLTALTESHMQLLYMVQ